MGSGRPLRRLAICGGRPALPERFYVGRPNIGDRERLLQRINDVLTSRWLTNDGRYVREFERRIAALVGVKHCLAVCNATIGLEIAGRALGLRGEVIVPSFTFAATAHALQWQGVTPIFADVDQRTHALDPRDVERRITARTSGIIGAHLWGGACDVEALTALARRHQLKLMFDAAHAFGCSHQGRMIGNFGQVEVFSFHATKFCNSFEGGAIVTNDDALAARCRAMRSFGMTEAEEVSYVGTNGKMNEAAAAMGLTSLESLPKFIAANYDNYQTYRHHLSGLPGVRMITFDEQAEANYQYIILEIDEAAAGLSRDQLLTVLRAENVMAKRYFYPGCHRMAAYAEQPQNQNLHLPVTERLSEQTLALPTGLAVSKRDAAMIAEIIVSAITQAALVRQVLNGTEEKAANWRWDLQPARTAAA